MLIIMMMMMMIIIMIITIIIIIITITPITKSKFALRVFLYESQSSNVYFANST